MKRNHSSRLRVILGASLIGLTASMATPALAVDTHKSLNPASTFAGPTLDPQGQFLLAQALDACRRVVARQGVYVHSQPSVESPALGLIDSQRNVTIQDQGAMGWVPISAPLPGYVLASHLGLCQAAAPPPPDSCRRVIAQNGVAVSLTPAVGGRIVGEIPFDRRVTIENSGANGWVPISVPLRGYIPASELGYCQWPR